MVWINIGLLSRVITVYFSLSLPDSSKSDLLQTNEDADHFYKKDKQSRKYCIWEKNILLKYSFYFPVDKNILNHR